MAGAAKTWSSVAMVAAAVALLGAAPIPPSPVVAAGAGYQATMTMEMHSKTVVTLPTGPRTLPTDVQMKETVAVKVLAVSGGAASRVELTYAKVDAPGPEGTEERKVAGRTFVIERGRTAAGDPKVTEGGKAITGKLARKVWDDVSELLAPQAVTAFRQTVLAHPGKTFPVPPAIFQALTGSLESDRKLVSAELTLVKVDQGKATERLVTHEQMDAAGVTLDLNTTQTRELDAATGRAVGVTYESTIGGAGKLHTPVGALPAQMHGTGGGSASYVWEAAAKPKKAAGK